MISSFSQNPSTFVKFGQWIQRVKVLQGRIICICSFQRRLHTEDMTHQVSQDEGKGWIWNFKVLWQFDQRVLRADWHGIMVNCSLAWLQQRALFVCVWVFVRLEWVPYSETERLKDQGKLIDWVQAQLSKHNTCHHMPMPPLAKQLQASLLWVPSSCKLNEVKEQGTIYQRPF